MIRRVVGLARARSTRRHTPPHHRYPSGVSPGPLAITVMVATLVAACGPAASPTGPSGAAGANPAKKTAPLLVAGRGGTATVALGSIPLTLNDHTVAGDTEAARIVASTVWVQVFQVGPPDLTPQLDTAVVESAEVVSVNPQTVVYQIAPKAQWSDGVPVTAADFQYAWRSQRGGAIDIDGTPDSVASTLGYRDIASVASSDHGRTVTVTFRTPYADWESLFDDLLPAHVAEQVGWNHGFDSFDSHVLVSAGPWLITKWIPGREIVLAHNPRWWGPVPPFKRVVLEAVTTAAALARNMRTQRVKVAAPSTFDASLISELSALPSTESETTLGTTMLQLDFNIRHAPLSSVSIRQGIAHAIDRVGIVSTVTQPFEHYAWIDDSHLFANMQPAYDDNGTDYGTQNLSAADALLTDGGLLADTQGTWTLHGAPVTLDLTWAEDDPWSAAVGPLVASQLVSAGFDVETEPVTSAQLFATVLPSAAFELALVPVQATAYPSQLGGVFSPTATAGSPSLAQDWTGFDDTKIDSLFTQAQADLSANQAGAMYQEIDQDLWQDMPTLPLLAEPTFVAFSAAMVGVQDDPGGLGPLWGISQWAPLVPARTSHTESASKTSGARANMRGA